jgi:hypothetical protein
MFVRPGTATLVFHPPMDPRCYSSREELTQAVHDAISAALPENRR